MIKPKGSAIPSVPFNSPFNSWKNGIPGKQVFSIFAQKAHLNEDRLKTLYIKKAMEIGDESNPFFDIFSIFENFSKE